MKLSSTMIGIVAYYAFLGLVLWALSLTGGCSGGTRYIVKTRPLCDAVGRTADAVADCLDRAMIDGASTEVKAAALRAAREAATAHDYCFEDEL